MRCGHCYKPFNAYDHLVDETQDVVLDELAEPAEAPAPAQVLREEAALTEEHTPPPPTAPETEIELRPSDIPAGDEANGESMAVKPEMTTGEALSAPRLRAEQSAEQPTASAGSGETAVPELLQGDLSRLASASRSSWLLRSAQLSATVMLLLLLTAQYVWFMPRELLTRFPDSRAGLEWIYDQLGRDFPVPRDVARIHLLSRDVRVHPDYGNVLLVNAQLMNTASYRQPFPTVRLILFGVNGEVIAARGFRPEEYLAADVELRGGMQPDTPVQIGMELVAPGTTAVSYEFQFF